AAILLALISIPVANIGGFVIGFLFALIGGALSISWAPGEPQPEEEAPHTAPLDKQQPESEYAEGALHGATVPPQQPGDHGTASGYGTSSGYDGGTHRAG
ncbi:hypothetical protein G3M55_93950, partial [Streptomyces sp. SID8455]|nr:hypothetical protein [Streptomyces sp. SID8455]